LEDHRPAGVRGGARRRRVRAGSREGHGQVPGRGRGQHHQHLQPRGGGGLRRGDARGRPPVRAAPGGSPTAGVQAGHGRVPHRPRRPDGHGRRVRRSRRVHQAHVGARVKRLGVIGSMVWDTIYGRDPARPAIEEWGGISYSLAALDATLHDDWQIVPLVKVGRDLAARANEFLGTLHHVAPGARFLEVPAPNNRVTLRYYSSERRCEQMSGGVPPWTWPELGPQVTDLDALDLNFISGYEMAVGTAQLLRTALPIFIYADLHRLFLGQVSDRQRRPHRLRRRVRRDRGRVAASGRAAGSGVAGGYADGRPHPELPRRDRIAGSPARQADDGVTRLVEVHAQFDDRSFDQFAGTF